MVIVFAAALVSPVIASAPKTEAWYVFQTYPFSDIIHLNTNPGGWLNGYDEAYPYPEGGILGKYEAGKAYIATDLPPGGIEMSFLVINIASRDGWMYRIRDDLSIVGPDYIQLLTVSEESARAEGPTMDDEQRSMVTPQALYAFQTNPWSDIVYLNTGRAPWLYGWAEASGPAYPAPVLGYYMYGRFFFAMDYVDYTGGYELSFWAGSTSTRNGYVQRTIDGYSYAYDSFWLT